MATLFLGFHAGHRRVTAGALTSTTIVLPCAAHGRLCRNGQTGTAWAGGRLFTAICRGGLDFGGNPTPAINSKKQSALAPDSTLGLPLSRPSICQTIRPGQIIKCRANLSCFLPTTRSFLRLARTLPNPPSRLSSSTMAVMKTLARTRRSRKAPSKIDWFAFPRRLVLSAKLRARKAVAIPYIECIWPQGGTQDAGELRMANLQPRKYPPWPKEPLVQPANWRNLPQRLVRPEFPEIKPEFIVSAQPDYEGISARHIRSSWAHVNYR